MNDRESAGVRGVTRRLDRWEGRIWIALVVVVPVVGGFLSWVFWDHLHDSQESLSSTIRNLALVIGGIDAALLAIWRSRVAERQAAAARSQVATGEQGLLSERFQRGAEVLGSDVLSVRLGGIYALQRLADEHPEQYHIETMKLFCAFARNPTGEAGVPGVTDSRGRDPMEEIDGPTLREDVQSIMSYIGSRSQMGIEIEKKNSFILDLRGTSLVGALLQRANLAGADLDRANLTDAILTNADLSDARFGMFYPNPPVNGLTQYQLDQACANPDNPPS